MLSILPIHKTTSSAPSPPTRSTAITTYPVSSTCDPLTYSYCQSVSRRSIKAHPHCFAFQQPMFSPFQHVRFDRGRMIRVPDEEQEHTSQVHNLRMEKKALRNQLDSLVSDNTNLRRAHDRLSRQIAELKQQLESSDRGRITANKKNRELSAQITSKNQAYRDLCIDYNMLDDELHSLRRSHQQPNRQPRRN
ncbi:MAG: hypothetical protein L6R38_007026 [Xanthoria sp. 2 TBL-2021]|nr:MAG: hypothetical protein L6R38_007026 [Xanthoria sp. 2 TBL-2021]